MAIAISGSSCRPNKAQSLFDRLEVSNRFAEDCNAAVAGHYPNQASVPDVQTTLSAEGHCFNLSLLNLEELEKVAPIIAGVLGQHDIPSATFILLCQEYSFEGQTFKKDEASFMMGAYEIHADGSLKELDLQTVMKGSSSAASGLE